MEITEFRKRVCAKASIHLRTLQLSYDMFQGLDLRVGIILHLTDTGDIYIQRKQTV